MALDTFLDTLSVIAALAGAYMAWHFARKAERSAEASQRLAAMSALEEWRRELREWGGEVVDVLSEAEYRLRSKSRDNSDAILENCDYRLSALIDRGRQYLPNQDKELHGTNKPYAYRGYRHACLDPLVAAVRVIDRKTVPQGRDSPDALMEMRRIFVSRLQRILDPELRNEEIANLLALSGREKGVDPSLGGLLPDSRIPTGAEALLRDPAELRRLRSLVEAESLESIERDASDTHQARGSGT